ncbi:MAG TPA: ABC transporter substrate-binding protein [Stellaceae bacterium]|nr:ABC transporter substrate-binding protein [Stellaceae bacterium]
MPHRGLEQLPLGAGRGLPNFGGAKITVTFADDLGNPSVAQAQALRLIMHDRVAAMIGAGDATTTLSASTLAEHHHTPFLTPGPAVPAITGRGFKFVFRTAPLPDDIARVYANFLNFLKQSERKVGTVALVFADGDFDRPRVAPLREGLTAAGFHVGDIVYPANLGDLSTPVAELRDMSPDAAIFACGTADAALFAKTMKNAGYKPPIMIGDNGGFSRADFVTGVGNLAEGLIDRSAWSLGAPDSATEIVNDLYRARSGRDLDDVSSQVMQGFFVLADAINRAGSTDAAAIQKALQQTNLNRDQLMVGYKGVKFDESGQNTLAWTNLTQLQNKEYVTVWPAEPAVAKLELPFRGWE